MNNDRCRTPHRVFAAALLGWAVMLASPVASADGSRSFNSLSPQNQTELVGVKDKWDSMPPARQDELLRRAENWRNMPPEKQAEIRERWQRWQQLPPEKRQELKQRFEKFRELPPEQRKALREKWQALSPEERTARRQQFFDQNNARGRNNDRPARLRRDGEMRERGGDQR
jgi:hypothetical protein